MRYLSLLMISFCFIGCSKNKSPVCVVKDALVDAAAVAVSSGLQCANAAAVKASVNAAALKIVKSCQASSAQSIVGDVCGMLATTLVDSLVDGAIPAEWECSSQMAKDQLLDLVKGACSKI